MKALYNGIKNSTALNYLGFTDIAIIKFLKK